MHIHFLMILARRWAAHVPSVSSYVVSGLLGLLLVLLSVHGDEQEAHFQKNLIVRSTPTNGASSASVSVGSLEQHRMERRRERRRLLRVAGTSSTSASTATTVRRARVAMQQSSASQESLKPAAPAAAAFPAFGAAVFPVGNVPDWGAMRTPAAWERTFDALPVHAFVAVPVYDLSLLTLPLHVLLRRFDAEALSSITAKLFYSTRHFGAYDLDAGEFTGVHPGIDLKLAHGTPVGAIGGGRVHVVRTDANMGLHVIIEHRLPEEGTLFSLYGHLDVALVEPDAPVSPGQIIGRVGMTGSTTAPHLHLQIDRDTGARPHRRYWPQRMPSPEEAEVWTVHPIRFIEKYR